MISLEEARQRILQFLPTLGSEALLLQDALRRVASEKISAALDLPPFDNSAMDGYAVQVRDLTNASASNPVSLRCLDHIAAGSSAENFLLPGCCARIFTGSPLPPGSDAVVMQEDTRVEGEQVWFSEPVRPLENLRLKGEDIREGTTLVKQGERIRAGHLALLGACGHSRVKVAQLPRISLLATGNELREPGQAIQAGEIYESNRALLAGLLQELRIVPKILPIVRDSLQETAAALEQAFRHSEIVITTGGVSVGEHDFIKQAFAELGGKTEIWRIAVRPGKPFVFGQLGGKFLFGLPGNPVSAFVCYLLLVRPALLRMQQASHLELEQVTGTLRDDLLNKGDRRHFVRVKLQNGEAILAGPQASHMLSSMAECNALVDVPPGTTLRAGETVNAWLVP